MKISRGYKNCNPGNIRINSDVFQGEIIPSQDEAFKQFTSMAYGYRAMFKMLRNYKIRRGCNTIREMITRWAPPSDNNHTENYIKAVSTSANILPDVEIDVNNEDIMTRIISGMSKVENGVPANMADIKAGWGLL